MLRYLLVLIVVLQSGLTYADPQGDLRQGLQDLRSKKFVEARGPLESAYNSAQDERLKVSAAEGLVSVYQELSESEKYMEMADFLLSRQVRSTSWSVGASRIAGIMKAQGKLDRAVERYEQKLKDAPEDMVALAVLFAIYNGSGRTDRARAAELAARLKPLQKQKGIAAAQQLEMEAARNEQVAASNLKDAAQIWLDVGELESARKAAEASALAPPEKRSDILSYFHHDGLGDVFMNLEDPKLAALQYEEALAYAPAGLKAMVQKKLDEARGKIKN